MDMKEIISAVILVATLFAGTQFLKEIHDSVRRAALEKAATGLPSLTEMTHALRKKKEIRRDVKK
jgi:hypothetical protein